MADLAATTAELGGGLAADCSLFVGFLKEIIRKHELG